MKHRLVAYRNDTEEEAFDIPLLDIYLTNKIAEAANLRKDNPDQKLIACYALEDFTFFLEPDEE